MLPNSHQRDSASSPSFPIFICITLPRVLFYINSLVPSISSYPALHTNTICYLHSKDQFVYRKRMNNRMGRVAAAEFANRNRLRSQKPLPKRGQIKSKIAANAFHSIISVISRASSSGFNSPRKI
ncbi:hypothetical protein VNO80_08733 [Phaseolus coccineus]|uniref:Uncharacterized protein n=1 Tax=Phaseolus coccineus TaxID=3886 RepID=A0AAN9N5J6_PHACN